MGAITRPPLDGWLPDGYARRLGPIPLVHLPRIPSSARELTASVIRSERPAGPPSCRRAWRFQRPTPAGHPFARRIWRALRVLDARPTTYVDAGSCAYWREQQAVAGILVGEKNRC